MTANTFFQPNLAFLHSVYPSSPIMIPATTKVSFIATKQNCITGSLNSILLHSRFDPIKEAKRFVNGHSIAKDEHIILYGFGLGFHVQELARKIGRNGHLTVIELNPDILSAVIKHSDIRTLWNMCTFNLIYAQDEKNAIRQIQKFLSQSDNTSARFIIHQPSFKCIPSQFRNIARIIEMELAERKTNHIFKKQYMENFEQNISTIVQSPGINELKGSFYHKSAILVGAGPSLDDSIPLLKNFQDKSYVCAVDTAFPLLLENSIIPDFIVSVDPQIYTKRHFRIAPPNPIPLIISPISNAQVIADYPGPFIIFLQKNHSFTGIFESYLANKGFTIAGSSVSCIALDIFAQFGFKNIILAGMDFAFPLMKAYAVNSMESLQLFSHSDKFNTLETLHQKRIRKENLMMVPSYNNQQVLTSSTLYTYRKNIENLVEIHTPKVTFYNLARNGACIRGTQPVTHTYIEELLINEPKKKSVYLKKTQADLTLDKHLNTEFKRFKSSLI